MTSIYNWDVVASNNATADADINWAEGQAPSTVNDSARMMMARIKQLIIDLGGGTATAGTANARTLTSSVPFTTHANGRVVTFRSHAANTQATTLNVNNIGAKPILKAINGEISALEGGELVTGAMYTAMYSTDLNSGSGAWLVANPTPISPIAPGVIWDTASAAAPAGWLFCAGQAVSRATYAALFSAIGTTWGNGNGSTTFNVPDFRGRVTAGKDNMGGTAANRITNSGSGIVGTTLGASGGSQSHTLTTQQMPSHNHSGSTNATGAHTHGVEVGAYNVDGTGRAARGSSTTELRVNNATISAGNHSHTLSINDTGGGGAHPIMQPTSIVNKIIKT